MLTVLNVTEFLCSNMNSYILCYNIFPVHFYESTMDLEQLYKNVQKKYTFPENLKLEQVTALKTLLDKRNIMAVLPTGFGKSFIAWLLPLLLDEASYNLH